MIERSADIHVVKIGLFTRYDRELSEYDVPNEARKAVARHSRDVTSAGT